MNLNMRLISLALLLGPAAFMSAGDDQPQAVSIGDLATRVLPERETPWSAMVRADLNRRMGEANRRSRLATVQLESLRQWQDFAKPKIAALRASMGQWPKAPVAVKLHVTSSIEGDGYRLQNVLYQSRPGWWVTAHLYSPSEPGKRMPGIILCHSHHRPKEQGELQDMGMTWARAGCIVLVPDHLGHGERRQHPFVTSKDYAGSFRVSRQDYYFRYDTGIQLHLVGESLIGWMAWDLMRGVDLLLSREGIDPGRIMLLGAVAGGGDPAAVTAALDSRITCAVPFNFGGPQPETRYPLPADAESSFNYAGSGGWESTRNLRRSAADGFLPYVIVGSIAPRYLVFAHEFNWHRERDPVWSRLQSIYKLHEVADRLSFTHGRGELRGRSPEATHCTNIGPFHRRLIHDSFKRWFGIDVSPKTEFRDRKTSADLQCLTDAANDKLRPERLVDLLPKLARQRLGKVRAASVHLSRAERRRQMRVRLDKVLGRTKISDFGSEKTIEEIRLAIDGAKAVNATLERVVLDVEQGIKVPMLLIYRSGRPKAERRVVIGLAQSGKAGFLKHRADEILRLIQGNRVVCLPDVRGTGETRADNGRGRYSTDTGRSSTELMLGGTTVAGRLRDVLSVTSYLRSRGFRSFTLWGESFARPNDPKRDFNVPRRVDGRPGQSEPLGGLLALLGGLYDDSVASICIRGGLVSFADVLRHQQVLIPHDVVVPGLLAVADMDDLAATFVPKRLRMTQMVDHLNRRVGTEEVRGRFLVSHLSYAMYRQGQHLDLSDRKESLAEWLDKE